MKTNTSLSRLARLTHPGLVFGEAEDSLQAIGEVIAIVAGIAATAQFVRTHAAGHRLTSSSSIGQITVTTGDKPAITTART